MSTLLFDSAKQLSTNMRITLALMLASIILLACIKVNVISNPRSQTFVNDIELAQVTTGHNTQLA